MSEPLTPAAREAIRRYAPHVSYWSAQALRLLDDLERCQGEREHMRFLLREARAHVARSEGDPQHLTVSIDQALR